MRYACKFFVPDFNDPQVNSEADQQNCVDATDICEALVVGLRGLLPQDQRHNLVAIAQKYSVVITKVPDDWESSHYPHV